MRLLHRTVVITGAGGGIGRARLDVLVTGAGIAGGGLLIEQDPSDWLRVIDVNLSGTYRAIGAALPTIIAAWSGRIVTIASVFGKIGAYGFVTLSVDGGFVMS